MNKLLLKFLNSPVESFNVNSYNKLRKSLKKIRKSLDSRTKELLNAKIQQYEDQFRSDPADLPF